MLKGERGWIERERENFSLPPHRRQSTEMKNETNTHSPVRPSSTSSPSTQSHYPPGCPDQMVLKYFLAATSSMLELFPPTDSTKQSPAVPSSSRQRAFFYLWCWKIFQILLLFCFFVVGKQCEKTNMTSGPKVKQSMWTSDFQPRGREGGRRRGGGGAAAANIKLLGHCFQSQDISCNYCWKKLNKLPIRLFYWQIIRKRLMESQEFQHITITVSLKAPL